MLVFFLFSWLVVSKGFCKYPPFVTKALRRAFLGDLYKQVVYQLEVASTWIQTAPY